MADLYNEKVMDHFMKPRNVGTIDNPDGVGETGNPTCGDIMKMFLKISKNKAGEDYIEDIKFQTFGCGAAVATSSITTEMVKGKTIKEAESLTNEKVAEELGGLPPVKMHCSNLAANALRDAIKNYKEKQK
jgi:nitrogen fixation NifU-like protein